MCKKCVIVTMVALLAGLGFYLLAPPPKQFAGGNDSALADTIATDQLVPLDQIDHGAWDRLLKEYVDADGMVDYPAWKQSQADLAGLNGYLNTLGHGNPQTKTSPAGKLAFWINAYNAVTVQGILKVYPTSSIRKHTARAFGYNIWDDLLLRVGSQSYSLNAMEHKILRKLDEPRIHFAIVCASIGCPRLRNEAYMPERIEAQLADNARDFFSRPRNFRAEPAGRTVHVSSILKWFGDDFGPTPRQGLQRLAEYLPDEAARRLVEKGEFSVKYLPYDWDLNDRKPKSQ